MATQLNDTLSVKREAPKPRSFSKPRRLGVTVHTAG